MTGDRLVGATGSDALDPDALARLERIGGATLVQRMIALYLENAAVRVATLREAVRSGVLDDARRAAHSLKSTSANVGAHRVQALSAQVEAAAAASDAPAVVALAAELDSAFDAACARLRSLTGVQT